MKSKKGSIIVFLTMLFAALTILIFAFIENSIDRGINSSMESLGRVWGLNILSEYDLHLYQDYGILAFWGNEEKVGNKIDYYARETLKDKKYVHYGGAGISLAAFNLLDVNNFQLSIAENLHLLRMKAKEHEERAILNQKVIGELPSNQDSKVALNEDEKAETLIYLFNHFNSHNKIVNTKSFFRNEQEYIVCGNYSDEKNYKGIKNRYVLERVLANSAFIHTQSDMMAETLALATVMTPGPEAKVTQEALIESWATCESENDWKILEAGGRVPNFKTKDSWALKLGEKGFVNKDNPTGLKYEDYLKILIIEKGEQKLLYAMMDLIQINMKFAYYNDFLLADYSTGLSYSIMVNNEEHDFCKEYIPR